MVSIGAILGKSPAPVKPRAASSVVKRPHPR